MDAIKAQLALLQQRFAALNATQRMLVGTLVAVMAITLFYWSRYAGSPEMVPVLDTALTADQVGHADAALDGHGIPYTVVGGKILVPTDRKAEALATLMYAEALPDNKESAFEEMNKQLTLFSSPSDHEDSHIMALQATLADVIRHMDGVRTATVIINGKSERRIEDSVAPTASVFVSSRGGIEKPKLLAKAIAKGVAGTVSGLRQELVSVTIDDRSYSVTPDGGNGLGDGDSLMEIRQVAEARIVAKIRNDLLSDIPGLKVAVTCDVENRTIAHHKLSYDKDGSLSLTAQQKDRTDETTGGSAAAAEPGVGANSAAFIPTQATVAGANGATSNTNESTTSTQNAFGSTDETIATPAGKDKILSGTVMVPRSYMRAIYKQDNGKDPEGPALVSYATLKLAEMKTGLKTSIAIKNDEDLSVNMYTDLLPMAAATAPVATSSASLAVVTGHAKEIALGMLAVVSLFLMSSMVRKTAAAPAMAMAGGSGGGIASGGLGALGGLANVSLAGTSPFAPSVSSILAGEALAGEVGGGTATLDGVEMDEDSLRTQQMLEQVSTMVKENPDNAAAMVKRWLNRT